MGNSKVPGADCANCPLEKEAFVPTKVALGIPKVIVVGEAPGYQEAAGGVPFTGPSGKLIRTILDSYKVKHDEISFTNVCLCRPPGNQTPPATAIKACKPRLLAEVEASGADILALGGTAAQAILETTEGISKLRVGPPRQWRDQRVIASWHPAYCLRAADAFPALVNDVGKLFQHSLDKWYEPAWRYFEDPEEALLAIEQLKENTFGPLVIDIEVGVEKDFSFAHPNEYDLLCVGIGYAKRKAVVIGETACHDERVLKAMYDLFKGRKLVAHNGKFDLSGLFYRLGALELWFDTMLASYALDERPGNHGLKVLAVERLGAPRYDEEIIKYIPNKGSYANIPRPILYKYNAYDISCTYDLFELFSEALDAVDGLRQLHDHMVAASNQLMYLELNGITIDLEYSDALAKDYLTSLEGMVDAINESTGEYNDINPRSPQQVKAFLKFVGVNVVNTDKETLETLQGRLSATHPARQFVELLLGHRRAAKRYGTYIKGIRQRMYRGRVYTTYMLHGSTSGRLASRNPNLQNIIRDKTIRKQFTVAKPDNVFIQADYKQAEGRVITWLAQDEYLRSIFADDSRDLFNELSDGLYGPGNWAKEERVRTKAFFYGLSYGREAYSIGLEYGMSVSEAEKTLRSFMDLIPATAAWQKSIRRKVLNGEDLVTPFGRRRRFYLITDQNKKDVLNEALSFVPQSTASDICLSALIRLRPMLRGLGFIRLTIHDALVVECAERNMERVSELLKTEMVAAGNRIQDYVPFSVDVSQGKNWGEL